MEIRMDWKKKLPVIGCMALYVLIIWMIDKGCPIKMVTGISCPGCGITRAWNCLLHLDLDGAFFYHPLFWMAPFMGLAFLFEEKLPKKQLKFFWWVVIILFLAVYVIRLCLIDQQVVSVDLANGLIGKLYKFVFIR